MAEPRITVEIGVSADGAPCEVFLYCNQEGRAELIRELQRLDERNDHFHMFSEE